MSAKTDAIQLDALVESPASPKSAPGKFPLFHPLSRRFHMLLLLMVGFCCSSFMRMHIAMTMTCMVNSTALAIEGDGSDVFNEVEAVADGDCNAGDSGSKKVVVDYGGDLSWDAHQQNLIFSGTFWGSLVTVLPSMFFIQRFSHRIVLQAAVATYIISTVFTPLLATHLGPIAVFMARVFMGLGEGFVLPASNALIADWFPSTERSTAAAIFTTGNQLASAGGMPMAAMLCASSLGWPSIFYTIGCKVMHSEERAYLMATIAQRSKKSISAQKVPYGKMLTSLPFLAQLQCHYIVNLMITLYTIYLPSYLKEVLHLGVIANGTFMAVPNVLGFLVKICWGIGSDRAKEWNVVSPTTAVKISQGIANFGSTTALLMIAFLLDCSNPTLGFFIFCLLYISQGTFVSGFYTSLLSLAPRYTATMSSISMFLAMLGRLSTPALVELVKKNGTREEWKLLFLLTAAISALSGTIFLLFGSGEEQDWGKEDKVAGESLVDFNNAEQLAEADGDDVDVVDAIKRRVREDSLCV